MIERVTKMWVGPENEPIFSEQGFEVEIQDEAAGEFLVITGAYEGAYHSISVNKEEWEHLKGVIEKMLLEIK